ncbi:hypothetical protein QQF64_011517 [Cirrhinus molitorella]|uniref:Uncharacterized protein n=1 Tax=Cirrhinus molitorella TaxID=172907 RepID=A0ABR3M3M3_9TELE
MEDTPSCHIHNDKRVCLPGKRMLDGNLLRIWQMSSQSAFSFTSHLPWRALVTALKHEEISFTSLRTQTGFKA